MVDRRNHAKRLLFGGVLLGSFVSVWLALVEVTLVALGAGGSRLAGAPGSLLPFDALVVLVLGPFGGLVLGTTVATVHLVAVRLAGRRSLEAQWKGRAYVMLALPLVAAAVVEAFRGPWISRQPGVTWIALGAGMGLLVLFWLVSRLVVHIAGRLAAGHASMPVRVTAPLVLLLASVLCVLGDLRVLPRLYPFFHWVAALGAVLTAWMGFGALHLAWGRDMRRRLGLLAQPQRTLIASTLVLGVGLLGHRAVGSSHRLRGLLFERTALASKAMTLSARLGLLPSPAPLRATYSESEPRTRPRPTSAPMLRGADVVLVTVDALRMDRLGLAGHRRMRGGVPRSLTPNIDRLFGRGLRFRRAYCPTPRSSYSIVSLLTGLPLYTLAQLGIERAWPTLAEILGSRGGYRTAGFYPEAVFGIDRQKFTRYRDEHLGFGHFHFEDEDLPASTRTDQVLSYLDRTHSTARGGDTRPLFLWVHYFDPHEPYRVHPGYEGFGDSPLSRYEAEIAYVDAQVGRLLDVVRARRKKTILVLTGDHGEEFGEHGGANHGSSLFEEQLHVPLLIAGPGIPDREIQTPVSTVALVPTLLGWLGVATPPPLGDMPDLSELLGEGERYAPAVMADLDQQRMVVVGHHKLIEDRGRSYVTLYDLKRDPREQRPLDIDTAGEPRRLASRLLGLLERRLRELGRMGRIGRVPDVGPLGVALAAADTERRRRAVRIALAKALRGVLGSSAHDALRRAVERDTDPEVRHRALAILALEGDRKAAPPERLAQMLGRWDLPDDLRLAKGIALARVGHEAALPALTYLLPRLASLDQRTAVVRAMGLLPMATAESVDSLTEALRDYELAVPVLRTLAVLHGREAARDAVTRAVPWIYPLLNRCHEHPGHREEAMATLACVGTEQSELLLGQWLLVEPEAALRARGIAQLVASTAGPGNAPGFPWPLLPLVGPGLEAPAGACLEGRGCRLEAARTTLLVEEPAAVSPTASLWLVMEKGPGDLPVATWNEQPLRFERVEQATLPRGGVASLCGLPEGFEVLRAVLPAPAGGRALLGLRDPRGSGLVVRGLALLPAPPGRAEPGAGAAQRGSERGGSPQGRAPGSSPDAGAHPDSGASPTRPPSSRP